MLFPIIIIVVLIFIFMNPSGRGNNIGFRRDENNALDILDKRFANGEISEEEYLKRRSILKDK
jgi:putative membrane protein